MMFFSALLAFVRHFPRECLAALALIVFAAGTALVPPMLLGRFIDALGGGQFVILLGIGYFAASALAGLFESGQDAMIVAVGQRMMHALRSRMAAKLPKLPAAYFDRHEAGGTAALFLKDVDAIDVLFTDGILSLFANSLRIVAILAAILWTSRGLFVLLCVALPVLFLFTHLVQRRVLAAQSANRSAVARIVACIPETLASFRMIRGFGIEPWMERRYGAMLDDGYHAMDRTNFYDSVYSPIIKSAGAAVVAVMMVLAAGAGPRGFFALSVGDAVAMTAYVLAVFEPLEALGMEIQTIQAAAAALGRIRAFLGEQELPQAQSHEGTKTSVADVPCIEFRDVTFGYEAEKPVLSHLSFSVHPGEHVVLRGRTGAGKTTILRLVAGLYTPQSGEVLVGGKRAADVLPRERRHLYGIAGQAFSPIPGTVRDQLTLGESDVTDAMIERALETAGIAGAVHALPQGLSTPMEAAGLSEGERHLLGFARAIVYDPCILLLDECTAHLDSGTEAMLLAAIRRMAEGRAMLSIAHRWSAAMAETRAIMLGGEE
ncbi:MAG: ABC transporter ATP-binding protein [Selenomonas sp.]|nr:ABC transporter ATP-binding protein [Selenomonas sp.]